MQLEQQNYSYCYMILRYYGIMHLTLFGRIRCEAVSLLEL